MLRELFYLAVDSCHSVTADGPDEEKPNPDDTSGDGRMRC